MFGAALEPYSESANFVLSTIELRTDADFDGLPDEYERSAGTDILRNDADEDPDADGRTNVEEFNSGTDPFLYTHQTNVFAVSAAFALNTSKKVPDADKDSLPDWWEALYQFAASSGGPADDPDGDGHSNLQEYHNGTNPLQTENHALSIALSGVFSVKTHLLNYTLGADADSDGLPDWWERKYGSNPQLYDADRDIDFDGLTALDEYFAGRNPNVDDMILESDAFSATFALRTIQPRRDADSDGIPDQAELRFTGSATLFDPAADSDGDGFTNLHEYNAGTDPNVKDDTSNSAAISDYFRYDSGGLRVSYWQDTDLEGMPDWWELRYGFLVRTPDGDSNPDNDLFSTLQEFQFGTNPRLYDSQRPEDTISGNFVVNTGGTLRDTDNDGLPDAWEMEWFSSLATSGTDDSDGDGLNNAAERFAGTDPSSAQSTLHGSIATTATGQVVLSWSTVPGKSYRVIAFGNLAQPMASRVLSEVTAGGTQATLQIDLAGGAEFLVIEVLE